jgi:hypothetical protein
MKKLTVLALCLCLLFTKEIYASKTIHLHFINKTARSGTAFFYGPDYMRGPFLLSKIGSANWDAELPHTMVAGLSVSIVKPITECILVGTAGILAIDVNKYQGDVITVTFVDDRKDGSCTCTGSACSSERI